MKRYKLENGHDEFVVQHTTRDGVEFGYIDDNPAIKTGNYVQVFGRSYVMPIKREPRRFEILRMKEGYLSAKPVSHLDEPLNEDEAIIVSEVLE